MNALSTRFFATLFACCNCICCRAQNDHATNKPSYSDEQAEKVKSLIELYTKNRDTIKRYGVAMYVDLTHEDFANPSRNYSKDEWYLHSVDHENKKVRHDDLAMDALESKNGVYANSPAIVRSLFFHGDNLQQLTTNRAMSVSFDADSDESTKKEFLVPQTNFDPWDLPLVGGGVLLEKRSVKPERCELFDKCQFEKIEAPTLHETKVTFRIPTQQDTIYRVWFTTASGDMPTKVEMEADLEHFRGVMWSARTRWKKQGDAWLPVEVLWVQNMGKPDEPNGRLTCHFHSSWVFGDHMPNVVFATHDTFISPRDLRTKILEFASLTSD